MNDVEFKTYKKLKEQKSLTRNALPKSVMTSDVFQGLIDSGIVRKMRAGRGARFEIADEGAYQQFFSFHFPEDVAVTTKADNVRKYRNSKICPTSSPHVFMLRGFAPIHVEHQQVDMRFHTSAYGLFACAAAHIQAGKICFVENLDTFFVVEKLLGADYTYIHTYGRIGKESLSVFECGEVLVFVDYDFNGLDEYLRIKEVFPTAVLYVPDNYNELFLRYSRSLSGNKATQTRRVRECKEEVVEMIRESVLRNNRFLEQQYWAYD
ncbi:MAG: hypothetical protein LUF04_14880 [Bacteroides sp.]|nr:hypothetical protein [Bacteroides sp.]